MHKSNRFLAGLFAVCLVAPVAGKSSPQGERPPLIRLRDIAPGIRIEMRYATPDNFTHEKLYPAAECWLAEPAARRLARVQSKLEKKGFGLKVWDGYRPISVQKILWNRVPDDRYVANPAKGSRHNRGASVDLTLVDKNGIEFPMPTKFDEFSERAHRDFMDLPPDVIQNRKILEEAMESEGFIGLPTEWWHFDDPGWRELALRDESLTAASLATDKPGVVPMVIPEQTHQLILVIAPSWSSNTGEMTLFERKERWAPISSAPVSLGAKGMAWGRGLNPLEWKGPVKKEGDMRTPAGVFSLGSAYGPQSAPPTGTSWPYQPINEKWFCVDDPKSSSYNQIVTTASGTVKKDWRSAETMKRSDPLYDWVINIEQNFPDVKAGCGSCIFFHVWRKPGGATEGCVAMEENDIRRMIGWLRPADKPLAVFLTEESYRALKSPWGLP